MNSTNDFCFIFKYSIRASGVVDGELVAETLEKKERICLGVLHNAIVFTSSPQLGRITESDAHRVIRVILEEKKSE